MRSSLPIRVPPLAQDCVCAEIDGQEYDVAPLQNSPGKAEDRVHHATGKRDERDAEDNRQQQLETA